MAGRAGSRRTAGKKGQLKWRQARRNLHKRTLTLRWLHMSHARRSRVALEFGGPAGGTTGPARNEFSGSGACCGVT
jgi:hypothetical protein